MIRVETDGDVGTITLALARPDHPLADGRPLQLKDLVPVTCVLPDDGFGIHHLVKRAFNYAAEDLVVLGPCAQPAHFSDSRITGTCICLTRIISGLAYSNVSNFLHNLG